ncbi:serine/threonine-protein kinase [Capnocytophaga canis]|uniref:serine/threonine-protein kinase n=1 Tax=Capnocytophaga canis TaxID=1848903 RepID=UPI001AC85569|nr:serine/threonine-protein kinase [Capnocytophaga canis]GIM62126.1 hypothetical protein CAPN008_21760 [Capnocytophaga canis]
MKESIKFEDHFEKIDNSHNGLIGKGGFSEVYKVRYKKDNSIYALKILNYNVKDSNVHKRIQDFENEVAFLKRLTHDSIVRYIDDFVIDEKPAILMELVEGKSLDQLLKEENYFNTVDVIEVAKQISGALMTCHYLQVPEKIGLISDTQIFREYAIIHNDIHTKNIIQVKNEQGEIQYKLIDFGLSFVNPESARTSLKVNGWKEFKSPEKWEEKTLDTRSDIYSFGVVLYSLLTGQAPFPCDDYQSSIKEVLLMNSCLNDPVPDIWSIRKSKIYGDSPVTPSQPDFPYWLNELVLKCLEKDPNNRFRSGKELNAQIQDGIKGVLSDEWTPNESPIITVHSDTFFNDNNRDTGNTVGNPEEKVEKKQPEEAISHKGKNKPRFAVKINKYHILIALLLCLLAVGFVWISKDKEDTPPPESENIKILKAYFVADEKVLDKKEIETLSQFFRFPFYYYTQNYTKEEFENHYIESVSRYKEKDVRIDSIVPVPNTDNTKYRVYGEQRKYKKDKNTYNVGKIKDEFTLKDAKIISIRKVD